MYTHTYTWVTDVSIKWSGEEIVVTDNTAELSKGAFDLYLQKAAHVTSNLRSGMFVQASNL